MLQVCELYRNPRGCLAVTDVMTRMQLKTSPSFGLVVKSDGLFLLDLEGMQSGCSSQTRDMISYVDRRSFAHAYGVFCVAVVDCDGVFCAHIDG